MTQHGRFFEVKTPPSSENVGCSWNGAVFQYGVHLWLTLNAALVVPGW